MPFPGLPRASVLAAALGLLCACGPPSLPVTGPPPEPDAGRPDGGGDAGPVTSVDGGPLCAPDPPPDPIGPAQVTPGASGQYLLRGRVVTPDTVFDPGEVLVVGAKIDCVGDCSQRPTYGAATRIETRGVIFPGLVDGHNHTQYDYLPFWSPSPPQLFQNRYQWPQRQDYKDAVKSVNANEAAFVCEQVKYGELVAMLGGATTIEGTFNIDRKCFRTLVHNAEYSELTSSTRTNIGGIGSVNATTDAPGLRADMLSGKLTAYILHLAEGIDASSKAEFADLVNKGLLLGPTVIIHGTALGAAEFAQMASVGAKLVWSPQSNLVLYGATTDVAAALAAGVSVSLAPDWTLSGGPTILHELKAARTLACSKWPGLLDAKALVKMVTSTPADAMAIKASVGRLAPGLNADLLVIRDRGLDPYRALVEAHLADVRMVMISGNLRYGDAALVDATGRAPCESLAVCGENKRVCVPDGTAATDKLNQGMVDVLSAVGGFYANPISIATCP